MDRQLYDDLIAVTRDSGVAEGKRGSALVAAGVGLMFAETINGLEGKPEGLDLEAIADDIHDLLEGEIMRLARRAHAEIVSRFVAPRLN